MIGVTVISEYSWYDRTRAALPEEMIVVQEVESRAVYRPWTYLAPFVVRFAAVDEASVQTNLKVPGQRLADLYFFGRWAPVSKLPIAVDCNQLRRADLSDGVEFASDGEVLNANWIEADKTDLVISATCEIQQ